MKKIVSLLVATVMLIMLVSCSFVILPEEEDSDRKFEVYHAEADYTV